MAEKKNSKNEYDDGNIPQVDLPKDVIPDKLPYKDDPGRERDCRK